MIRKTHSGVASDLHRAMPYGGGPVTYTGPGGALKWLGSALRRWAVPYGGGAGDLHLDRPMTLKVMGRSSVESIFYVATAAGRGAARTCG